MLSFHMIFICYLHIPHEIFFMMRLSYVIFDRCLNFLCFKLIYFFNSMLNYFSNVFLGISVSTVYLAIDQLFHTDFSTFQFMIRRYKFFFFLELNDFILRFQIKIIFKFNQVVNSILHSDIRLYLFASTFVHFKFPFNIVSN